jgi:glycosyltransferase involved in cell wall biosynthesis
MTIIPSETLSDRILPQPQPVPCRIAVLLPCYNEALAIAEVVEFFKKALPDATIYVFDNASTDATAAEALRAGAIVYFEPLRGKGHVVRRMFADIDADVYVVSDGDGTYDPLAAPQMVERLRRGRLDMVVGVRRRMEGGAYRRGHVLGNKLFNWLLAKTFGRQFTDIFSGYRVFSRRFVKSFPAISSGFEIETEISVHAMDLKIQFAEMPVAYFKRQSGSASKLHTYRDGMRILSFILLLLKEIKPVLFFGSFALLLGVAGVALGTVPVADYVRTGLVPHLPTAILSAGIIVLACLSLVSGIILDSVSRGRRETRRLFYLMQRGPPPASGDGVDE